VRNVTPARIAVPPARAKQNRLLLLVLVVVVLVLLFRACGAHESKYESIARQFTQAVQNDDVPAVQKLENAETAVQTSKGRVGSASDRLAPLGKIKSVKDTTPSGAARGVHEFLVTFDNGSVQERFTFDPQDKVYTFNFRAPRQTPT